MRPLSSAIERERRAKLFFFISALVLLLATLIFVQNMLVSFILAFVTYYLIAPVVDFLERRGLPRLWATTIPFLLITVGVTVCGILFFPLLLSQVQTLQSSAPQYIESASQLLNRFESQISQYSSVVGANDYHINIQPRLTDWMTANMDRLPTLISQSLTILLLVPFFAFFMLLDGRDFMRGILNLVPNGIFELILNLNHQIGTQVGGFIRARLLESIVVGILVGAGLMIMGFPYALLLALIAGLLNVIPYLGPVIGALPAFLIALVNGGSSSDLLILLMIYGTAQVIDAVILVPFLVAKIVDLHPVTVVLAILIGSQLGGVVGMIICIPVFSALKVTTIAIYRHMTHFRN
jgi:putative permease